MGALVRLFVPSNLVNQWMQGALMTNQADDETTPQSFVLQGLSPLLNCHWAVSNRTIVGR